MQAVDTQGFGSTTRAQEEPSPEKIAGSLTFPDRSRPLRRPADTVFHSRPGSIMDDSKC